MCRNIKKLRQPDRLSTDVELEEAALQFVRKISGYRVPSQKNKVVFETAVSFQTNGIPAGVASFPTTFYVKLNK